MTLEHILYRINSRIGFTSFLQNILWEIYQQAHKQGLL